VKMEEHFKEALNRAVANEPPAVDAWTRFEERAVHGRRVRVFAAIATATVIALASIVVVPRLGRGSGINLAIDAPSPSSSTTTQTVDPYAGWKTYESTLHDFTLRYPEDWTVKIVEGNPEVLAPGQQTTAASELTMAVTLKFFNSKLYDPKWREFGLDPGTRPDGRPFLRHVAEPLDSGGKRIEYSIDWSTCFGSTGTPPCVRSARTLFVAITVGTKALGDEYLKTAESIVTSIEYSGTNG